VVVFHFIFLFELKRRRRKKGRRRAGTQEGKFNYSHFKMK
jgi:hypothetical protein